MRSALLVLAALLASCGTHDGTNWPDTPWDQQCTAAPCLIGSPTFCFSFTSDDFDIYHVNDFMRTRGWRFNGQQYPNSIHMAVTRPQTQDGLADTFATDLDEAVLYAVKHKDEPAKSSAIYGGVEGGPSEEAASFIEAVMAGMMDEQQALPPVGV